MNIVINPFQPKTIQDARKALAKYKRDIPKKAATLIEKLSEFGSTYASNYFGSVIYDLDYYDSTPLEQASITVKTTKGKAADNVFRYTISASGNEIAFIEFGAGVNLNSHGDPYHEFRPEGIVGIGEYGYGHGKQRSWFFNGSDGLSRRTSGTPEQPGMWLTAEQMRLQLEKMVREVWK